MGFIPDAALDKHVALLGTTGSGKTSVAKSGIVEPDLRDGRRVIVIDPTSAWWGLRLAKDGRGKGFPIYIFGGDHGDYPLRAANARLLAEAFATSSDSAIFDTSQMTVAERTAFFTEFAETFRRKNKGWVRFVIDEAHLFMPQQGAKVGGGVPAMLHAGNNLVSLGRSRGLRVVMISQRAAKLHKDSLSMAHSLIAMQLLSPQDRGAINDWVSDQADPTKGKEIIASLPSLVPGEAWVWAPQAKYLERVKFPRPITFDSSSAPEDDDGDGPTLAPINLDALKGRLATVEAEVKANDPKALKAEVARLTRELASAGAADPAAVSHAEQRGYDRGHAEGGDQVMRGVANLSAGLADAVGRAEAACADAKRLLGSFATFTDAMATERTKRPVAHPQRATPVPPAKREINGSLPDGLKGPHQKIVDAIRWWNVLGISAPSHSQVAFIAGYSHKSGTWATYLSHLRSMGIIEGRGDLVLTQAGLDVANEPDTPPSGDQLRSTVLSKVDGPLRKILEPIIASYPEGLSHGDAADRAGYSPQSGTWATYLSRLRSLDLIEGRGALKAQEWLFP